MDISMKNQTTRRQAIGENDWSPVDIIARISFASRGCNFLPVNAKLTPDVLGTSMGFAA
jgi:hypothetical protein